jgi:hypothetical protein
VKSSPHQGYSGTPEGYLAGVAQGADRNAASEAVASTEIDDLVTGIDESL